MSSKKWIFIWFISPVLYIFFILTTINLFNLPLRFSNSISYDVKLNFIKNNHLLKNSNTIVVGSSMALNNINGIKLEDSRKINKVANISSWGIQTSEVLQLIKLISLKQVDYIIYATQYIDFESTKLKDIDDNEVKKYLNNEFVLYPYKTTIESFMNNIENNVRYENIYFDPNKYTYLNYDRTGSINFTFDSKYIKKSRWESQYKSNYSLSVKCFKDLVILYTICKKNNIKLIVVTTPMRKSILQNNENLLNIFTKYTNKLVGLSNQYNFTYINTHKILKLSDRYFVDKIHLNKDGATLVSNELIKLIN